jgi:hypothetical protein
MAGNRGVDAKVKKEVEEEESRREKPDWILPVSATFVQNVTYPPRQIPAGYRVLISSAPFLALLGELKVKHSREHLELKLLRQRIHHCDSIGHSALA